MSASMRSRCSTGHWDPRKASGVAREYDDPELLKVLLTIWLKSGQMCSKRLGPALPVWLEHYERHYGVLPPGSRAKLLKISPASIDRLLRPIKARQIRTRNSGTKPGTLLRNQIPIRTSNEEIDRPGYLEADTVAHCGGSMSGSFIWSAISLAADSPCASPGAGRTTRTTMPMWSRKTGLTCAS